MSVCRPDGRRLRRPASAGGDFKSAGEEGATVATHKPGNRYYLACPYCGAALDRAAVAYKPRRPEMAALGKFGVEVSQIATPAIGLTQIVAAWASAVADPDKMTAFRCDRWARPKSSTQGLDSGILDRCREDYALSVVPTGLPRFGGLDTGDRLWLVARESESALCKRFAWADSFSPATARPWPQLFGARLTCLCRYRQRREIAREHVRLISRQTTRRRSARKASGLSTPAAVVWDGTRLARASRRMLEFSLKPGSGIVHELRLTQEGHAYPVIRANRDETIQRAIDEFLCYDDGLVAVVDGKIRTAPVMRMPAASPGCAEAVNVMSEHFISGSRKVTSSDGKTLNFIDGVANHYLLANAYSALAETVVAGESMHVGSQSAGRVTGMIDGVARGSLDSFGGPLL